jgi:tRNA 2-selenouridine synthase
MFLASENFFEAFKSARTFLDVRSEGEYHDGAFDGVRNIPILNTRERHEIGLCYKNEGNEAAIALGHRIVSGSLRSSRIQQWIEYVRNEKPIAIFCWRGGMRSQLSQSWLNEHNVNIPRVLGGYKALRNFLIQFLQEHTPTFDLVVISGRTGSGKTQLLRSLSKTEQVIDLEHLAKHRGSSFGACFEPQPTQATFENNLVISLIQKMNSHRPIFLESESRAIGRLHIPLLFFEKMRSSPIIVLEASMTERVSAILNEYVKEPFELLKTNSNENPNIQIQTLLTKNLTKIKDRLGGARFVECLNLLKDACAAKSDEDFSSHRRWIEKVLEYYYDPYYEKSLQTQSDQIVFRGNQKEVSQAFTMGDLRLANDGRKFLA